MVIETHYQVEDTYMPVISFGTGPKALVILSGVSLCGLEGQGEGVARAYEEFTKNYTVYLFDRRKKLNPGFGVEEMAEDVYNVLSTIGITEADVYGVSQGGMMAQCLAINHPKLVRKLVLCSTLCRTNNTMHTAALEWIEYAEKADVVGLNRLFFRRVYSHKFLEQVEDILPELEKKGSREDCARFAILARACDTFDIMDRVAEIKCPTLVLGDVNDQVTGADGSRELAKAIGCEIFLYEQFSHAVYDEAGDIKARIRQFLSNSI